MEGEIAVIRGSDGYSGLLAALRRRRDELGIANDTVDEVAKMADGLTGKILGKNHSRMFGPVSFGAIMQALAFKIVLVEDRDALAWLRRQGDYRPRDERWVRTNRRKQANGSKHSKRYRISKQTSAQMNALRSLKLSAKTRLEIARSGALARTKKLPKVTRRRIARKAAIDRWKRRPRVARPSTVRQVTV